MRSIAKMFWITDPSTKDNGTKTWDHPYIEFMCLSRCEHRLVQGAHNADLQRSTRYLLVFIVITDDVVHQIGIQMATVVQNYLNAW